MPLSIIVPCHNSASTIRGAIESVKKQTNEDWELVIVNDGSTDDTRQIIEEYARGDERIRIINLSKNGGVASARKAGLENSQYEYIGFLDSDDTLDENFVSRMLETAKQYDCDVVWCQYREINRDSSGAKIIRNKLPKNKLLYSEDVLKSFFDSTPGIASLWNKIYSRNCIERMSTTRFNPERRRAEDWEFNLMLFQKEGRFMVINDCLYNYLRIGNSSAMRIFADIDFPLHFRSIDLLVECNLKHNLGYSEQEIYRNTAYPIFEHLFHSAKTTSYLSYRQKIENNRFNNFLQKTDFSSLPISYKVPAILIKIHFPKIAYLISKVLNKIHL